MPAFTSERSKRVISELSPGLRAVANAAIKHVDFSLFEGRRDLETQRRYYSEGKSHINGVTEWSKHQVFTASEIEVITEMSGTLPDMPTWVMDPWAHAFDFVPYPLPGNDWNNRPLFTHYAGFFLGIGWEKGVRLTWGGDWDGDFRWRDQKFHDFPHIQEEMA